MRSIYTFCIIASCFLVVSSCAKEERNFLALDAEKTGVYFQNTLTPSPELNILNYLYYYNGAGVLAADFNNDGKIDLFFTGNQVADVLYLNQGNFNFTKGQEFPKNLKNGNWSTGATYVDINNDGLLDIYICKASGYGALKGRNQLWVNQGTDKNQLPSFKEEASKYGLDFSGLSTHAAFFDYDLDGDLDLYLLNHSVHPNRNYGHGGLREGYHPQFGDVLFQNNNGYFEDRSEEAGIFQGRIGYGLGLSIGDINGDQYPDIYVGNDFFENDYLYLNQKDGTFREVISNDPLQLGHTTHYSMGNSLADLNNDGKLDILSLDMLPENLKTYKTSGLEYGYPIYRQYLAKNYAPQYMQNTLHINIDGERFSEIAQLSGIAATEWSWGVLPADFDNDGLTDIFISNGILGATNDMDYMNFIANEDIQKRIDKGMAKTDLPLTKEIPEKKVPNYFFSNTGDLQFINQTSSWFDDDPTFSHGSVYADLDNDGDLDLVVNNTNDPVGIFKNNSPLSNSLKVQFRGSSKNQLGIGATVSLFGTQNQTQQNFPVKGYLSTVPPELHFGVGTDTLIDSLIVNWPDGKQQKLVKVPANKLLTLAYENASFEAIEITKRVPAITKYSVLDSIIDFKHQENVSVDFDREPLIPYAGSNEGPSIAIADVNHDQREDIFIGGAKKQPSALFLQDANGGFQQVKTNVFELLAIREVIASTFFDANGDGWLDLLVGYGGNEFQSGKNLHPELFINQQGTLHRLPSAIPPALEANISDIEATDLDGDGDFDLILATDQMPGNFGHGAKNYILFNDGQGNFEDSTASFAPNFRDFGSIKELKVVDFNKDGKKDIIAVGHWNPIGLFLNNGKTLVLTQATGLENTEGLWESIEVVDIDKDGDLDIICGNWGLNSKLTASLEKPLSLYRNDFDGNGQEEAIVTYYHGVVETPFASKDELVKQLPILNKEFLSYAKFADASIQELFGRDQLADSYTKEVFTLETTLFKNLGNNQFQILELPLMAMASQIRKILVKDLDEDGFPELILLGNNHHISTQLGRLDALHGLILKNNGKGEYKEIEHLKIDGQVNDAVPINHSGKTAFLVARNNQTPVLLKVNE